MVSFDAYHNWLGIPPHEQPPNFYRLLGVVLFESNPEVIQQAADRQSLRVGAYQGGPQGELCQQLLSEIAMAQFCLLDPQQKAAYDGQLQEGLAQRGERAVAPPPPAWSSGAGQFSPPPAQFGPQTPQSAPQAPQFAPQAGMGPTNPGQGVQGPMSMPGLPSPQPAPTSGYPPGAPAPMPVERSGTLSYANALMPAGMPMPSPQPVMQMAPTMMSAPPGFAPAAPALLLRPRCRWPRPFQLRGRSSQLRPLGRRRRRTCRPRPRNGRSMNWKIWPRSRPPDAVS